MKAVRYKNRGGLPLKGQPEALPFSRAAFMPGLSRCWADKMFVKNKILCYNYKRCIKDFYVPAPVMGPLVQREEVNGLRKYEVIYIIRPDFDEEKYRAIVERYNTLIQDNGGEVLKVDPWGKRRLAYEINKIREGYYVLLEISCDTELPTELERNFKISDEIMRYLITRMEA